MTEVSDVVVVGAGVIGAAIAHELTRRGIGTAVVEQGPSPGYGATGRSGGMVRAYDPDPAVAALAEEGTRSYGDPARWAGAPAPLRRVGAVTVAGPEHEPAFVRALGRLGPGRGRLAVGGPVLGVALAGGIALVEPGAGWVDPGEVTGRWLAAAERGGARILVGRRVLEVTERAGRPAVVLEDGHVLGAGRVVLARGAWAATPLRGLPPSVGRTRSIQTVVVRRPAGRSAHATFVDLRTGAYGRPCAAQESWVGAPHEVWDIDPDAPAWPSAAHEESVRRLASANLPWLRDQPTVRGVRGFDAYDDGPEVLRPAGVPDVWSVRGWNGGGVKVAPAVGRLVADGLGSGVATVQPAGSAP